VRLFYRKILCPSRILFKRFLKIKTYLFTSLKPQLFLLNLAHIPDQSGIFGSSLERSRSSTEILNQNLMQIGQGVIENKQKTEMIFSLYILCWSVRLHPINAKLAKLIKLNIEATQSCVTHGNGKVSSNFRFL